MTAPDHTIEPLKNFLHERGHPHMGILNRFNLTPSLSRSRAKSRTEAASFVLMVTSPWSEDLTNGAALRLPIVRFFERLTDQTLFPERSGLQTTSAHIRLGPGQMEALDGRASCRVHWLV